MGEFVRTTLLVIPAILSLILAAVALYILQDVYHRLYELESKIQNLTNETQVIKESITYVKSWIGENFDNVEYLSKIEDLVKEYQYICRDRITGVYNLACLYFFLERIGFEYEDDKNIYFKKDHFAGLKDFFNKKAGDCEDYALFLYNVLDVLEKNNIYSILVPIRRSIFELVDINFDIQFCWWCDRTKIIRERYFVVAETEGNIYYLQYYKKYYINIRNKSKYIICFSIYNESEGHCAIAICNKNYTVVDIIERDLKVFEECDVIDSVGTVEKYSRDTFTIRIFERGVRYMTALGSLPITTIVVAMDKNNMCIKTGVGVACFKL